MNSILKKSLSFLMVFCMMFFTFAFAANVSAAEETVTLSAGTHDGSKITWTAADGDITITQAKLSSTTAVNSNYISAPRVYKGHVLSFEASNGIKITNISLTYTGTYYGNSVTAGTAISGTSVTGTENITSTLSSTSGGKHNFASVDANGVEAMHIHNVASTNVQLRLTAIVVTYVVGEASTDPEIELSASYSYALINNTLQLTATPKNFEPAEYTWSSSNEEVATVTDGVLTGLSMGTTTVKVVAGEVESNELTIKVYPNNAEPITIAEALEICEFVGTSGTPLKYTAVGTVADEPTFDSSYNSVTFNLTDGTNTIKVYGMKVSAEGDVVKGDKLVVTGSLLQYGSTAEFNYDTTYVEYATVTFMDEEEVIESYDVEVGTVLTAPETPEKEGFNFVCWLNGELEYDFATAVTSHLTLTAKWASTALEVFEVTFDANGGTGEYDAQQVVEGEKVVAVTDPVKQYATFLGWYNGETKFDLENDVVTANMTLTAKWEEWNQSVVEFVETETKASLNFAYASDTTGTISTESVLDFSTNADRVSQDADSQVWSANGITFTNEKASASSNVVDNVNPIRCYKNSTITIDASQMTKIVFSTSTSSSYTIKGTEKVSVAYTEFTSASGTTTLVFSEPTDSVTITLSANQVRINNITVYSETSGTSYAFNNVAMRFQGAISAELYNELVAEGAEVKFGVVAAKTSKLGDQSLFENGTFFECTPALTETDDTYLFALLLTNIPATDFAQEVVAAAYVQIDGVKYYMSTKTFSVNSLAQYYVDNLASDEAIAPHVDALKALAKAN